MPEAVIVSSVRTPVGRAFKGALRATRPDDLAALAIEEALARVPGLEAKEIDDVILGCAMPEGEQGMNVARIASLRAGLPVETSAMTINRFCSSGLQSIALAAERIRGGSAQVILAGGTESMSLVPMGGNKISPNPWLVGVMIDEPGIGGNLVAAHRHQGHGFSAACQDDLRGPASNALRGKRNRLQTGRAEAVDGHRRSVDRQTGAKRGDARHVHALLAFGHGAAENHVVDFFRLK